MLGGIGAGACLTVLMNALGNRQQMSDANVDAMHAHAAAMTGTVAPRVLDVQGPASTPQPPVAPSPQLPAISNTAVDTVTTGGPSLEDDPKAKFEDLLATLQQHSEEARESSAVLKKCMQQQQEQYTQVFGEIQKFMQSQTQQKAQKPQPMELSAATIQTLAGLMQPAAPNLDPPERCDDVNAPGSVAPSGIAPASAPAPANTLRASFDAINQNLQRLVHDSASKAEAGKAMQTTLMVLQNVLNNPGSEKHKKVNTSSSRFKELFSAGGAAAELLKLAGFQYQEPNFIFASEQGMDVLQRVRDLLTDGQKNLDQLWAGRPAVDLVPEGMPPGRKQVPDVDERVVEDVAGSRVSPPHLSSSGSLGSDAYLGRGTRSDPSGSVDPQFQGVLGPSVTASSVSAPGVGSGGPGPVGSSSQGAVAGVAGPVAPADSGGAKPWQRYHSSSVSGMPMSHRGQGESVAEDSLQETPSRGGSSSSAHIESSQSPGHAVSKPSPQVAHPAESQDAEPAMAHPAESDCVHPSQHVGGSPSQHTTSQLAHVAEGGGQEEMQPQSGG